MATVTAYLNWGDWKARCPTCNAGELVYPNKPFVCSRCFDGIHAVMPMQIQSPNGAFATISVPDDERRAQAIRKAKSAGQIHEVIFPGNKKQIEDIVRVRKVQHRNWRPEMTEKDLLKENEENGV